MQCRMKRYCIQCPFLLLEISITISTSSQSFLYFPKKSIDLIFLKAQKFYFQVRDSGRGVDCRVVTFQNDVKSGSSGCNGLFGPGQDPLTGSPAAHLGPREEGSVAAFTDPPANTDGIRYCRRAIRIDELSRLLFPLSFLVFNVFYWSYYTQWSK